MPDPSPITTAAVSGFSMPLDEAMSTQRAIRRLKTDPVDPALVLRLIELALKAPTGSNAQNWEFVVVQDRAVKERLGTLNRRAWRDTIPRFSYAPAALDGNRYERLAAFFKEHGLIKTVPPLSSYAVELP